MVAVETGVERLFGGWMNGMGIVTAEAVALGDEEEISEREAKGTAREIEES
jgi:hypothetical protein